MTIRSVDALERGEKLLDLPCPGESHPYKPSRTGVHIGDAFIEFTIEEQQDVVWPHGKPPPSDDFEAWLKWKGSRPGPDYDQRPSGRLGVKLRRERRVVASARRPR